MSDHDDTIHTPVAQRLGRRAARAALVALLAGGALVGVQAAQAAPASAASQVKGCFRSVMYPPQHLEGVTVQLRVYSPTSGVGSLVKSGRLNSDGCGTFSNTPTNRNLIMYLPGSGVTTPYYAVPGGQASHLGTAWN